MAIRFAIASGNWSNSSIWDNGAIPLSADAVFANGNTITLDQNVTITSIYTSSASGNIFLPDIATPAMTTNSSPSGSAISSSVYGSQQPYLAFAQDGSGTWWTSGALNTGWLGYVFSTPKVIKRYSLWGYNSGSAPYSWTFEASNDGSTWTVLDTRTTINTTNIWVDYSFTNTTSYIYYRINISAVVTAGNYPAIYELNMTESSSTATSNVNGGTFQLPGNTTLNVLYGIYGGGNHCVSYVGTAGQTSYINAVLINGYAGSNTGLFCINHTGAGTLYISATDCIAGPFSNGTIQVNNSSAVCNISIKNIGSTNYSNGANVNLNAFNTVNIIGDLYGQNTANYGIAAVYVRGNGTVNITGNLYGGSQWPQYGGRYPAVQILAGTSTVNVTGNVLSSNLTNGGGPAIDVQVASTVNVVGNVTAGASYYPAIYSTPSAAVVDITGKLNAGLNVALYNSGTSYLTGPLINNGTLAAYQGRICILKDVPIRWKINRADTTTDNSMYSSDYAPEYPDIKDVRFGISYNGGLMTGTAKIPAESDVQKGFVYDGGRVGTGMLTASDIAAGIWSYLVSNINASNSIGYRLKNVSTPATLGEQIKGFNGL